ncbi:hypothetical protein HOE37_00915 [Candidatus Woesearchaeota archaeon]|jgi:hypothetical protein|nr:hypothetical protein [Candidatus Woesearchaeota archaeon]MBT4110397.1 hypothetical protein [Candidatus Woesearchaeota archaeon]MBT4336079.1 hypothetical protein [Candidatus Woesearchaeota archaeon]MBT4468942.1 hypothetical protein [Candidatus Woesearchaeota archaeon]MBT6744739.1 hypothetical protein [Candidatus Woesearchaeota archaeon]
MALFKWIFHKHINIDELKGEVKKLYSFFQEYILLFNQKGKTFSGIFHGGLNTLKLLLPQIEKSTRRLLNVLKKENQLIALLKDRNVLTNRETDEVLEIKEKINALKDILQEQLEIMSEIKEKINRIKWTFEEQVKISPTIDKLKKLFDQEHKILFSEEEFLERLVSDIVKDKEFPFLNRVSSPATEAAILADKYFSLMLMRGISGGYVKSIPKAIAEEKKGVAYYPGSFDDPIIIFCFPNIKYYVLQDPHRSGRQLKTNLELLQRFNILHNLKRKGRNSYTFLFNGKQKHLVAYYGVKGDSSKFIPPEIRRGVKVLMAKAFTVGLETKKRVFDKISPYLLPGSFIHERIVNEDILRQKGFKKLTEMWWIKE